MTSAIDPASSENNSGEFSTIALRVDRIDDLFHSFDPSPMERRSLSAEVDAYALEQIDGCQPSRGVRLRVTLPASEAACCDAVQSAVRHHFARATLRHQEALRKHFATGRRMLASAVVAALVLVLLSQMIAEWSDVSIIQKIANGISIVVWVTLWRPIEFMIYDWRGMDRELKTYIRLSKADVRCVVEG